MGIKVLGLHYTDDEIVCVTFPNLKTFTDHGTSVISRSQRVTLQRSQIKIHLGKHGSLLSRFPGAKGKIFFLRGKIVVLEGNWGFAAGGWQGGKFGQRNIIFEEILDGW